MRVFGTILVAGLCALGGQAAFAQAPGPMSKGHAHLNGALDCQKCHEGGTGVPEKKCLGCHDHRDLRQRIEAGKGFHADEEVRSKACKDCHAEHKEEPPGSGQGRKTTVDWRPFGGRQNFPHQRAGWPLTGAHRAQKCEKCHEKKMPKTGLTSFLGLRTECTTCHKTPHEFKDVRLSDCTVCHDFDSRRVPNLAATKFDHDKTDYPLVGAHTKNECKKCHADDLKTFQVKADFGDCKGCHEDSHKSVISANRKCSSCHDPTVKFEKTRFDHGKETRFALQGQHADNRCKSCHKLNSKPEKPSMECASCHVDVHKGRFGTETCGGCHPSGGPGWEDMIYAHDTKTKFALTGAHQKADCVSCHRNKEPKGFERFASADCASCHKHTEAHCGQFGMENCERCHVRGGDRTSKFDHSVTRFKLDGAHADPSCDACHKPAKLGDSAACKNTVKYTGLDPGCLSCHEDKLHKGELGNDCAKCHTGGRTWNIVAFDHNRDSRFALTGFHGIVDCASCHPGRKFKVDKLACSDCHTKDDVHEAKLGNDCAKCHETTGGAPKFDHDVHTRFLRTGVHARIECGRCHFLPPPEQRVVGAGSTEEVALAAQAPPGAPLDLQFRAPGQDCATCHPDPHRVYAQPASSTTKPRVLDCAECHGAESWKRPPKNGYHERAGFALTGAHTVLSCGLCHSGGTLQTGRGEQCGSCHVQDDVHAGAFGKDCGRCHEQLGWRPVSFSHMETGYVLEGVHRVLDCRECHNAGNYQIGSKCWSCHLGDYRGAGYHQGDALVAVDKKVSISPVTGKGSLDCGECHNQFSFFTSTYGTPEPGRLRK